MRPVMPAGIPAVKFLICIDEILLRKTLSKIADGCSQILLPLIHFHLQAHHDPARPVCVFHRIADHIFPRSANRSWLAAYIPAQGILLKNNRNFFRCRNLHGCFFELLFQTRTGDYFCLLCAVTSIQQLPHMLQILLHAAHIRQNSIRTLPVFRRQIRLRQKLGISFDDSKRCLDIVCQCRELLFFLLLCVPLSGQRIF